MNVDGAEGHKEFEGGAFIDLTRTSEINEKMWSELYLLNKEALLKKIDDFVLELNELREAISNNDKKKLEEKMIASSKIKKGVK